MKKNIFYPFLFSLVLLVSCTREMNFDSQPKYLVSLEASFDEKTKAQLSPEEGRAFAEWEANDAIGVFSGDRNVLFHATGAGQTTTIVTSETDVPTSSVYYGIFPYDSEASIVADSISTTLPTEQYADVNNFTHHIAVAVGEGGALSFKNVCALIKVNVSSDNVTKLVLSGNNNETVAGEIKIKVTADPTWKAPATSEAKNITVYPAEGQSVFEQGDYYIAVLPQTFEMGLKVLAYKGETASVIRNISNRITINRSTFISGAKSFGIKGKGTEAEPYILMTAQDVVDMRSLATLGGETWFEMGDNIDMSSVENYIPANYDENFERKIHFDGKNYTLDKFKCHFTGTYPSLFGVLYGSCKNLNITNADVVGTKVCGILGGYIGTDNKPATVSNVHIQGSVSSSSDRVGGFGGNIVGSTFSDCTADVTIVTDKSDAGGFGGKVQGVCSFENCEVKASVTAKQSGSQRSAGMVGWVNGTTVSFTNCKVLNGTTITDASDLSETDSVFNGGFIGHGNPSVSLTITNCSSDAVIESTYGRNIGGLMGVASTGQITVTKFSSAGKISGNTHLGGMVGLQEKDASLQVSSSNSSTKITGTSHYCGGFIGSVTNATASQLTLTDCYATGDVTSGGSSISGFVAYVDSGFVFTRCYATNNVTGVNNVGGLMGYMNAGTSEITDCYFTGKTITASGWVGGLVGRAADGSLSLSKSYYTGGITLGAARGGGIIGCIVSGTHTINQCYAVGTITGRQNHIGGILGSQVSGSATITQCWADVDITGAQMVGGIVGASENSSLTVKECYSRGNIEAYRGVGGLIGRIQCTSTIEKCIAWNPVIKSTRNSNENYATGAIVASVTAAGTFSSCLRRADMSYTDAYVPLCNHEDITNALPPMPTTGTQDDNQRAYHGKAAASGLSLKAVANSLGWTLDAYSTDPEFVAGSL